MTPIDLRQLIGNLPAEGGLAFDAKRRDVSAMAQLLSEGTCPTSAYNVLHYYPEHVSDVLDATKTLSSELRERNQAILAAMCNRLNGPQREIYARWKCREAARAAWAAILEISPMASKD